MTLLVTLASILALITAVGTTYMRQRPAPAVDVVLALGLLVLALGAPTPGAVFALTVSMLWFRSLYGSTWAAYARGLALVAATASGVVIGSGESHDNGPAALLAVAGIFATAFLGITGARFLRSAAVEREQELARHTVQAWAGAQLLGLTDAEEIRRVGWEAMNRVVDASTGLHVLMLQTTGQHLVARTSAHEGGTPVSIDLSYRARNDGYQRIKELDTVVGATCTWRVRPTPERRFSEWLAIGFKGPVSEDAVHSLDGLSTQLSLALRTSDEHQTLTRDARIDGVTGLANRRAFEIALLDTDTENDMASHLAVLFIDLDDFKDVNDTYGHLAGDTVLREVAVRLRATTRANDMCVRLGGDEFAVLTRVHDPDDAMRLGRRIVASLQLPVALDFGGHAQLGASVGVATAGPDLDPMGLVRRADIAMYAAKGAGKCTVRVYSPELENSSIVTAQRRSPHPATN